MALIDHNNNMDVLWGNESSHWKYELPTASKHGPPTELPYHVQRTSAYIVDKEERASLYLFVCFFVLFFEDFHTIEHTSTKSGMMAEFPLGEISFPDSKLFSLTIPLAPKHFRSPRRVFCLLLEDHSA
jgi:hypothetical protein